MTDPLPHRATDLPQLDRDDLETTAKHYAEYMRFDELAEQQTKVFEGEVERVLMRVDEFGSLMDAIRSDREKLFTKVIPPLVEKGKELQRVYTLVDRLEEFVRGISRSVREMEEQVNETANAYALIERHRTMNSFGLGSLSSKYLPVVGDFRIPWYFIKLTEGKYRKHLK